MPSSGPHPRRLTGDVALVTGAGRGIGRGIAIRLAAEGAAVAVLDVRAPEAEETVRQVTDMGERALAVVADVASRAQVSEAMARVEAELGPLSIVVNNAAVCPTAPFLEVDDALFATMLAVNLTGPFIVGQEGARLMARRGRGRIVNITSSSAGRASTNQSAYAASKAGLEALTRGMAFELGPVGINVNAVAPGTVDTELSKETIPEADRARRTERIPLGRLGRPADIAGAVAFLASPDADFVQGVVLPADGGFTIGGMRDGLIKR